MLHTKSGSNSGRRRLCFGGNFTTHTVEKRHDELRMIEGLQKSDGEVRPRKVSPASRICQKPATRDLGTSQIKYPAPDSRLVGLPPAPAEIARGELLLGRLRPERKKT